MNTILDCAGRLQTPIGRALLLSFAVFLSFFCETPRRRCGHTRRWCPRRSPMEAQRTTRPLTLASMQNLSGSCPSSRSMTNGSESRRYEVCDMVEVAAVYAKQLWLQRQTCICPKTGEYSYMQVHATTERYDTWEPNFWLKKSSPIEFVPSLVGVPMVVQHSSCDTLSGVSHGK